MPRRALSAVLIGWLAAAAALAQAQAPAAPARERRPAILVTVDDLPLALGERHPRLHERRHLTRALLAVLARHRVTAVGFVIWDQAKGRPDRDLLGRWLAAGHELGNHTASHSGFSDTPAEAYVADAERGRAGLA